MGKKKPVAAKVREELIDGLALALWSACGSPFPAAAQHRELQAFLVQMGYGCGEHFQ